MYKIVSDVVDVMKDAYPYLVEKRALVEATIIEEEKLFLKTLEEGERRLKELIDNSNDGKISGEDAFRLYDTYGFPFELTEECSADTKGAIKAPDGKYIKLKDTCKGVMGEYICAVDEKTGQFEAMKECGDIKGIVFGHDHCNCFEGVVDGINFIQTACASFRCYGKRYRGVRIFDIDENGNYETKFYTYKDLMGKGILNELAFIWDADGFLKQKIALIAGGVVGLGAIIAGIVNLLK